MASRAVGHQRGMVDEPRVGGQLRTADRLTQQRPVLAGLQAGEGQDPTVLGLVVARQGVGRGAIVRWRFPRHVQHQGERHRLTHGPQSHPEQRDIHDGGLAGALPVEERSHDPAGDGHGPDGVAEARCRWDGGQLVLGTLGPDRDPRAGPEGQRVVRALVGIGTALALAGAAHVDDVGVVGPDLLDPDLEFLADARELVGEEHVSGGGQLVEDLQPFRGGQIEPQAQLPAVGVLQQGVDVARHQGQTGRGQTTHGVTAFDVLDLDDLGAPVRQQGRRRRDKGVLGHLEDPDAPQYSSHYQPPTISVRRDGEDPSSPRFLPSDPGAIRASHPRIGMCTLTLRDWRSQLTSGGTHAGGRFSMKARIPSRGSSEWSRAQNIIG